MYTLAAQNTALVPKGKIREVYSDSKSDHGSGIQIQVTLNDMWKSYVNIYSMHLWGIR
jgi:hypothetical protein